MTSLTHCPHTVDSQALQSVLSQQALTRVMAILALLGSTEISHQGEHYPRKRMRGSRWLWGMNLMQGTTEVQSWWTQRLQLGHGCKL